MTDMQIVDLAKQLKEVEKEAYERGFSAGKKQATQAAIKAEVTKALRKQKKEHEATMSNIRSYVWDLRHELDMYDD